MLTQIFVLEVKCYMGLYAPRRTIMDSKIIIIIIIKPDPTLGLAKSDRHPISDTACNIFEKEKERVKDQLGVMSLIW
jgi:hypothetical protein